MAYLRTELELLDANELATRLNLHLSNTDELGDYWNVNDEKFTGDGIWISRPREEKIYFQLSDDNDRSDSKGLTVEEAVDWILRIEGQGAKVINLNESDLRKLLLSENIKAENFQWTGWRIPIYLDGVDIEPNNQDYEEIEGSFSSGGWLSQGSYQPDAIEVFKVEKWNIDEENLEEGFDHDEEVAHQADYYLGESFEEDKTKIEEAIQEHFQGYELNIEVNWI